MTKLRKLTRLMMLSGVLAAGGAQAALLSQALVPGENTILDESRETYVDANNDGRFGVGDVIFGYFRLSDYQPSGQSGNFQGWAVFSQQILTGSAGRNVIFGATTVAGLTLKDLLGGNANVGASAVSAFFDSANPLIDLINNNPPVANSMGDYINYINNNSTLRLVASLTDADDFLFSEVSLQSQAAGISVGADNSAIATATSALTLASNFGAASFTYNNTGLTFTDTVVTLDPLTGLPVLAEIAISTGSVAGAAGESELPQPKGWLEAGGTWNQCGPTGDTTPTAGATPCGFIDKNNFVVNVAVPEPSSIALTGLALLALGGGLARRKTNPSA